MKGVLTIKFNILKNSNIMIVCLWGIYFSCFWCFELIGCPLLLKKVVLSKFGHKKSNISLVEKCYSFFRINMSELETLISQNSKPVFIGIVSVLD